MESRLGDDLTRIGPGLGHRSKIWTVVKKRVAAKFKNGIQSIDEERIKLDGLAVESGWMKLVPEKFRNFYGLRYDQASTWTSISSKTRDQIIRDVPRTFSLYIEHQRYLRLQFPSDMRQYCDALQHILEVACHQDFGCGYCQGMNFLAATFLLSEASKRGAFILFAYMLKQCHLEILYNPKCSSLLEYMQYYEGRLRAHNKAVYDHLEAEEFPPLCYTVEWFTTCFLVSSPGELSACVIDLMLSGYSDIMIRVGLALMDHLETVIMQSNAEKLQLNFKKMLLLANCVEVMSRALTIPNDEMDGISRLETMKLNCDAMDPDAEWVNTMQSSSCRVHKTELAAEERLAGTSSQSDSGDHCTCATDAATAPHTQSVAIDITVTVTSLTVALSTAEETGASTVALPSEPANHHQHKHSSNDTVNGKEGGHRSNGHSHPHSQKHSHRHSTPSPSRRRVSSAPAPERSNSPSASADSSPISEFSNGHHCITAHGALDGHLMEDYI